jgi:hypothetical protein
VNTTNNTRLGDRQESEREIESEKERDQVRERDTERDRTEREITGEGENQRTHDPEELINGGSSP